VPDTGIIFENKSQLIRQENNSPVNLVNYEEWLVLYMDNELTPEQKKSVDQFMTSHPSAKQELDELSRTRLLADMAIVFPDKRSLYRKGEKVRSLPVPWWRIAAAAVLILAASLTAVIVLNKKSSSGHNEVAKTSGKEQKTTKNPVVTNTPDRSTGLAEQPGKKDEPKETTDPVIANNVQQVVPSIPKQTTSNIFANRNKINDKKLPDNLPVPVKKEESQIALTNQHPSNNLPQPINSAGINNDASNTNVIADTYKPIKPRELIIPPVTTYPTQPSYVSKNDEGGKKGKLRGFLRKVTRTFEKNTNINATDDQDRVLIGGLAIKL
jgi:hypothetical protein